jgi:hypothetical protein
MSERLWVEYETEEKVYKYSISFKGCEFVDDLIEEIRSDPRFSTLKNFEMTLCTPSGTTIEIDKSPSSLLPGNSSENPLHLQVSDASKPASDADLTSFWNSLRDIKNEDGILHFPVRPKFFPKRMKSLLYVRKAYEDLFGIILRNFYHEDPIKRRERMAITGTPGIGKRAFLFYILWRLANMETTRTVILRRQKDQKRIYVFQNDGCWVTLELKDMRHFLDDPTTWYLTDALLPPPGDVPAVTILVSPPANQYYSKFLTYLPNSPLHYLPLWSLDELKLLAEFYMKTLGEVERRFTTIGGIARYVLEEDEDLEAAIDGGISQILSSKSIPMPLREVSNEDDVINRIIHFEVKPPDYTRYKLTIASDYVAKKFSERLHDRHELELIYFLTFFDHVSFVGPTVGHLFESYAHRKLSAGGEFLVRSLDKNREKKMRFPPRQLMIFGNFSECTDPNIYYRPTAKNFACIDSFILGTGYFQMTISMEHKIVEERMKEIKKVMKMEKLYFVVPHTKYKEFKKQELIRETRNSNYRNDGETSTGGETFEEGEGSNRNNRRRKIKRVNNNQTLQEDLVRQYVISIPLNAEVSKWLHNYEQRRQEVQQGGS